MNTAVKKRPIFKPLTKYDIMLRRKFSTLRNKYALKRLPRKSYKKYHGIHTSPMRASTPPHMPTIFEDSAENRSKSANSSASVSSNKISIPRKQVAFVNSEDVLSYSQTPKKSSGIFNRMKSAFRTAFHTVKSRVKSAMRKTKKTNKTNT